MSNCQTVRVTMNTVPHLLTPSAHIQPSLPHRHGGGVLVKLFDNQIQKTQLLTIICMSRGTKWPSFSVIFPFMPVLPEKQHS